MSPAVISRLMNMEPSSNATLGRVGQPFPGDVQYIPSAHQMAMPPYERDRREPPPFIRRLSSGDIELRIRQQPREALQAMDGKEKHRKPVDPPPVVELIVRQDADPGQHFLQSPYLFMNITLYKPDSDEPVYANGSNVLIGTLVSSLHRLKDVNNRGNEFYTGFFIFGDISIKVCGHFRLLLSLFDLRPESREAVYLGSVTSRIFKVVPLKEFKGMYESTYLSRAFSDQGVRLRLRKEPRGGAGSKRGYQNYADDQQLANVPLDPNQYGSHYPGMSANKRQKPATPDVNSAQYPNNEGSSSASLTSAYAPLSYTSQQTTPAPAYNPTMPFSDHQRTIRRPTPALRHWASTSSIADHFPPPLNPLSDIDLGPVQNPNLQRRQVSMSAQAQQSHNLISSLQARGGDNLSIPSLSRDSTSISNYSQPHVSISEGQQPSTAPRIPHSLSLAHHTSPHSTSLPLPTSTLPLPAPQSHGSSHQPHDSVLMGTAQFNHTASLLQPEAYSDGAQLSLQSSDTYHLPARFDGQQQMNTGEGSLYPNASNMVQGPIEPWTSQGHG